MSKISDYFKGVRKEISRIRWTNKKDLIKYSLWSFLLCDRFISGFIEE